MKNVLVVAPHPDDETFGCAGTMLRHQAEGDSIHWLIVSQMDESIGFSGEQISARESQLKRVADKFGFASVTCAGLITTRLDGYSMGEVIGPIGEAVKAVKPEVVYLPYRGDVHTDHRVVFDAVVSSTKWFRYNSIKRVLAYETLSETDFGINPDANGFRPNVFVNITDYMGRKLEILDIYSSELGEFPFPRSLEAVGALASLRGVASGCKAAESFMLLKEIL